MDPLRGIFPAIHTAFDGAEELDPAAQRQLLRRLLKEGVQGLFACGTSAEFPFLSLAEREELAELALEEAAGQAAVIVHVGGLRPREAARLARHAARAGAAAVSSVPPFYYAYREDAVVDYVREVAQATGLPFLYYHIPERTGVMLDEGLAERLLAIPNLCGVKYSYGDLAFQDKLQRLGGPAFKVFCGTDELLLPSLTLGACGAIGSTYNFLAPLFLRLWESFGAGRLRDAEAMQRQANRVIDVLLKRPGIAGSKATLGILGDAVGPPRRPQSRLRPEEAEALERELKAAGFPN